MHFSPCENHFAMLMGWWISLWTSSIHVHCFCCRLLRSIGLLIERWNIKNFVPFLITSLECLLHLEDVDFESRMNNWNGYHLAHGNNHPAFVPQHHFVVVKDFKAIKLGLALNDLNSLSKNKESAYGTNWEVYWKIQIVTSAQRKLWRASKILQIKFYPNAWVQLHNKK